MPRNQLNPDQTGPPKDGDLLSSAVIVTTGTFTRKKMLNGEAFCIPPTLRWGASNCNAPSLTASLEPSGISSTMVQCQRTKSSNSSCDRTRFLSAGMDIRWPCPRPGFTRHKSYPHFSELARDRRRQKKLQAPAGSRDHHRLETLRKESFFLDIFPALHHTAPPTCVLPPETCLNPVG